MEKQQAEANLQYIRQMLEETRRSVTDNGMHYIVWTILPILGIIGTSIYLYIIWDEMNQMWGSLNYMALLEPIVWIWISVLSIGWGLTLFKIVRKTRLRPPNFVERIHSSVWLASGITMTIVLLGSLVPNPFEMINSLPIIAAIMAIPTYISALVYDIKWFRLIAFGWWSVAILFLFRIIFFSSSLYYLTSDIPGISYLFWGTQALAIIMMLLLQVLPAIYLQKQYKKPADARS